MHRASWSDLPVDLLGLLLRRLDVVSFVRCRAVCASWRSASLDRHCRPDSRGPWLLLSSSLGHDIQSRKFFNLYDDKTYVLPTRQINGHSWLVGCSEGFLVDVDGNLDFHVTNPLTGSHSTPLPNASTLPRLGDNDNLSPLMYFDKVILVPSARAAVMVYAGNRKVAFAGFGGSSWTALATVGLQDAVCNAVFHKGLLHVLLFTGAVLVFDLARPSQPTTRTRPLQFLLHDAGRRWFLRERCLVESPDGDRLLQVCTYERISTSVDHETDTAMPVTTVCRVLRFKLLELEEGTYEWKEVDSLGELTLLLGHKSWILLDTSESASLRKNAVYLMHPNRMGSMMYDLEDGSNQDWDSTLGRMKNIGSAILLTPSLF